jgi:hypothetical protein
LKKLFYVYEHWRPDTNQCIYVGKGSGNRARNMNRDRCNQHRGIIKDLEERGLCIEVKIFIGGLTEPEAFERERSRIKFMLDSGEPIVNILNVPEYNKRFGNPKEKHPLWGKKHSEESKKKMRESAKNRPKRKHTQETKEKMQKSALERPDFQQNMEKMWSLNSLKHKELN